MQATGTAGRLFEGFAASSPASLQEGPLTVALFISLAGKSIEVLGIFLQDGGNSGTPMATLRIKNFPGDLYNRLKHQAEREHRLLNQQIIHTLERAVDQEKNLSIMGLEGLGKELWEGIDAVEYIREERDSWES